MRNAGGKSYVQKISSNHEIFLGTRVICYEAYSLPKGEVVELTEKQIKDALKGITTDEVYGLELSEAGELVMDKKNFFTTNMMKKIHTNTLIPMVEEDCLAILFYIVVGTHKEKVKKVLVLFYEWKVTNTRFILRRESASPLRPCFYGLYNCFSITII